jgi:hypothetical protein
MSVRGSLKTMSIEDVMDWIDRRELKGDLEIEHASVTRRLHLAYGCVAGASSSHPAEYLGQMLINAGHLAEDALREAFAAVTGHGISLGKYLVEYGLVSQAALRETLELKIRESVYDVMSWDDGIFTFEPDAGKPRLIEFEIALPLRDCMVAGKDRVQRWRALRQVISTDEVRFWVPDKGLLQTLAPGSPDARFVGYCARAMTVREMVLEEHALPYPIYEQLAGMLERHLIRPDRRKGRRTPAGGTIVDPQELIQAARGRAAGGDRGGAVSLARQAFEAAPGDAEIKKVFQSLERALFAELARKLLTKFRVPRLAKRREEIDALQLSAEERYFVGRIDGRWDLLSLMRVSPLREVEALITLERLASRGVITLD